MFLDWPVLAALGAGYFMVGTVVGSFLNVCVYRMPWQKSVIWPNSRCPRCFAGIAGFDNIPIVSWFVLRGECRQCGLPISARYPLVEAFTGALFLGAYVLDMIAGPRGAFGQVPPSQSGGRRLPLVCFWRCSWPRHSLTRNSGSFPTRSPTRGCSPGLRLRPCGRQSGRCRSDASSHWAALGLGVLGLVVGAGVTWAIRQVFSFVFRREAIGMGDVTLMGMIGAYLGWQAAVLTFFLAAFLGLGHALWKLARYVKKRLIGQPIIQQRSRTAL